MESRAPALLDDIASLEAISRNEEARRIFLLMAAIAQWGRTPNFDVEVAPDKGLDEVTKGRLVELAQDARLQSATARAISSAG